jgi:plasmid maintenance system antidote protein VapI
MIQSIHREIAASASAITNHMILRKSQAGGKAEEVLLQESSQVDLARDWLAGRVKGASW